MEEPRRRSERRSRPDRRDKGDRRTARWPGAALRAVPWEEQRAQFLTRYLFWALGLAYFNLGEPVARNETFWVAVNIAHAVYFALTTLFLWHARRRTFSPLRQRLAMGTDLLGVSFAVLADANIMSPAYLVYLVIILGNGMRYGLRAFAEAACGSLLLGLGMLGLRLTDSLGTLSVVSVFFILFIGIIILYSYSLMVNVERARAQLEQASSIDSLTGLLNRRGFNERAAELFRSLEREGRRAAVLFADLDGFKAVNDACGHHVGDYVLREFAAQLRRRIRDTDMAARFGGDEFVVVLPDATLKQARAVAERLKALVAALVHDDRFSLRLSVGAGEVPRDGRDLAGILAHVDMAMYEDKLSNPGGGARRGDGATPVPREDSSPLARGTLHHDVPG